MYSLGETRLAGTAYLPFHGQPAVVADGPRGSQLGAQRLGELLDDGQVVLLLNAAAHRDNQGRRCQIHGLPGRPERLFRRAADLRTIELRCEDFDFARPGWKGIGAERPGLDRNEAGPAPEWR